MTVIVFLKARLARLELADLGSFSPASYLSLEVSPKSFWKLPTEPPVLRLARLEKKRDMEELGEDGLYMLVVVEGLSDSDLSRAAGSSDCGLIENKTPPSDSVGMVAASTNLSND